MSGCMAKAAGLSQAIRAGELVGLSLAHGSPLTIDGRHAGDISFGGCKGFYLPAAATFLNSRGTLGKTRVFT